MLEMELYKMPIKSKIQANEQALEKIFSNDYFFEIPNYQRPYSWNIDQVGALIDDLTYFAFPSKNDDFDELKPYFLGSIVLIKGDDPDAKVIDGQQRLTTLTILLSVLRELLPVLCEEITEMIYQKGRFIAGTNDKFRLSLRPKDQQFFSNFIQRESGLSELPTEDKLPDSQDKIRVNALYLKNRLTENCTGKQLENLVKYLCLKCYLVVVQTSDEESAYRIFSVLNERGLQLSHADILKAEIIGVIPDAEQDDYTKKWEDVEEILGIERFKDLFAHIRMINRKVKAKDTILKEIRIYVKPTDRPTDFINNELIPYAKAFDDVKNATFGSVSNAESINFYLRWLNKIDNEDWIPPTISYLAKWGDKDTGKIVKFLKKLERLAFGLYVMRKNINSRMEKYGKILSAIENGNSEALEYSLSLNVDECKSILDSLSNDVYGTQFAKYLLLRIDADFSEGEATYTHPIITIEHVLPQNPNADSEWMKLFPDEEEREKLTHCLGNLVLLSSRKNAKAQNYDFDTKKYKYFKDDKISSFRLTTEVLNYDMWTHEVIHRRQDQLLERCKKIWDL